MGRALRPGAHRRVRGAGRDHPQHRRGAEGQAAAGRGGRAPQGADRRHRRLPALSPRPAALPAAHQARLRGRAPPVRPGRRSRPRFRARPCRDRGMRGLPVPAPRRLPARSRRPSPRPSWRSSWSRRSPRPMSRADLALVAQGRLDEAERAYERAIALEPEHYEAHYAYGRALLPARAQGGGGAAVPPRRGAAPQRHLRAR